MKYAKERPVKILDFNKELERLAALDADAAEIVRKTPSMFPFIHISSETDLYLYTRIFLHIHAKYPYQFRHKKSSHGCCLIYTLDGDGLLSLTDGTQLHLASGSLCFWPHTLTANIRIISSHWEHYMLLIDGAQASWFYDRYLSAFDSARTKALKAGHTKIPHMLHMHESTHDFASENTMRNLCNTTTLLAEVCTLAEQSRPHVQIPDYLQSIHRLFDEKYSDYYSLDLLEKEFKVNKYKLAKEFTHYYGIAPISYLGKRRIDAAKALLLSTDLKIHEIASRVGYENPTHFINSFKKQTGTTPLLYRKTGVDI